MLDIKRDHAIYGGGAGKDVIFQVDQTTHEPRLYTRDGQEIIPPTLKNLVGLGIPVDDNLRIRLAAETRVRQELLLQDRLAQARASAEAEERRRIDEGLPPSWEVPEITDGTKLGELEDL